jgi:2-dehydro-3-deoxygluconokinase
MVMLASADGRALARAELLRRSAGGAECNVAGGLAALGISASWVSRLGSDPFGDFIAADLAERGVRVLAERDADRPTGLYVKEQSAGASRMHYYRVGSAASAITPELFDIPEVTDALAVADLVHTSGITAGIVEEPDRLLAELEACRATHGFELSVDLNWRPVLWRGRDLGPLRRLVAAADLLLLGEDEALACLGTDGLAAVRDLVGRRPTIVLKSDSHLATAQTADGQITEVPALTVEVVEPIGAGDGFAAGFLAARLEGRPMTQCLRAGHLMAASVLSVPGDHAAPPPAEVRAALLQSSDADWSATRVGPGGIDSPVLPPADSPILAEDVRQG